MIPAAEEILRALVAIPSVSRLSNGPLLDEICRYLEPHGWQTLRYSYTSADGTEKANLLAFPGQFEETLPYVDLLFVCHTDTVPFRPEWATATLLTERDGMLHGCGSCDVKGSLAGLLAAALATDPSSLMAPVAFAFTAEEEIGCIGATRLVASGVIRPKRVIVCEPTSLHPATAGKGYGLAEVRVTGREAHSAFPAKGVSAIHTAAHFIVALERWQLDSERVCDSRFSPSYTTFNVGTVRGGSAKNIVAGECTFLVEWRPLPSEDPLRGFEVIERLANELKLTNSECVIEPTALRADPGFESGTSTRLGAVLSKALNKSEIGISFGSEATRFAGLADEVVVIGPGDMETAHSERECIPVSELREWTSVVRELLLQGARVEPPSAPIGSEHNELPD